MAPRVAHPGSSSLADRYSSYNPDFDDPSPSAGAGKSGLSLGAIFGFGGCGLGLLFILALIAFIIVGHAKVALMFLGSVGQTAIFWTNYGESWWLWGLGFFLTLLILGAQLPLWLKAAGLSPSDKQGNFQVALWSGLAGILVIAIIAGCYLASKYQVFLLFQHQHAFGATDPYFHLDYSFFVFTLPFIDAWMGFIIGLLAVSLITTGIILYSGEAKARWASAHLAILGALTLVYFFIGINFTIYHMAQSGHSWYSGVEAVGRNFAIPSYHVIQVILLILAVGLILWAAFGLRREDAGSGQYAAPTAVGSFLVVYFLGAVLLPAIYGAVAVSPNEQQAQRQTIADFLATSKYAWDLQPGTGVVNKQFGTPVAPTAQDLASDPGTLANVRIQDYRVLPETFEQMDRTRSYQIYDSTGLTVDRYPDAKGNPVEVMVGPREIDEANLPNNSFVGQTLIYTHGYGITTASVNQVGAEGEPLLLEGKEPEQLLQPAAPPDLVVSDPRIYCGVDTTDSVVVNSTQKEFDYPAQNGDQFNSYGNLPGGFPVPTTFFSKAALAFFGNTGDFSFLFSDAFTPASRVLLNRQISARITAIAPFLTPDGDPMVVSDPQIGHLVFIQAVDIRNDNFPESFQQSDGTSYERNVGFAVVDARTCQTTIYALNLNEPFTATYNSIYPGLFTPLDKMPMYLRQHLEYPQAYFTDQSTAYATVHVTDPSVAFNQSNVWRFSDEIVNGTQQPTEGYYVLMTLPGETKPQFVLLRTFSPASGGAGTGAASNVLASWLAANCDYTTNTPPTLTAVQLNSSDNVLGPLQFDNNINTDPTISAQITLLGQGGSSVVLGNVIVLPFANHSFLYVRPLYVQSNGGSFPQMKDVIVGTQTQVAEGTSLANALQTLYGQSVTPGGIESPNPGGTTPSPAGNQLTLTPAEDSLLNAILSAQSLYQQDLAAANYAAAGQEQQIISTDTTALQKLLAAKPSSPTPSPSPTPAKLTPYPSASVRPSPSP